MTSFRKGASVMAVEVAETRWPSARGGGRFDLAVEGWRAFSRDRLALLGLLIVAVASVATILAPWVSPDDPTGGLGTERLLAPLSGGHLLGTDGQGRDILSRLIWGGRVSLPIGVVPVAIALPTSVVLGITAGYFQGWVGQVIMRTLDVFLAFPLVLLGIAMVSVLGPGMMNVMIAIVLIEIPYMTRIVFTETSLMRRRDFILAARVSGSGMPTILFQEILPNILATLIVYSATIIGAMIVIGAGFSFLGIGIQPPTADWGIMTSDGRQVLGTSFHVAAIPGFTIVVVALAFNWIGDGLREALDPRLRSA